MVDDRPWLYYKLTSEPKGSGELKKKFIIKYPPYLVFSQVILLVLSCGGSYHNMHLNAQNCLLSLFDLEKSFEV